MSKVKDILTTVKNTLGIDHTPNTHRMLVKSIRKYTGTGEWIDVDRGTKLSVELYLMAFLRGHTKLLTDIRISVGYTFFYIKSKDIDFRVEYERLSISTLELIYDYLLNYYIEE